MGTAKSLLILVLLFCTAYSQESESELLGLKVSGWGATKFARFGSNTKHTKLNDDFDTDFSKQAVAQIQGGLKISKQYEEDFDICVHLGVSTAFPIFNASAIGKAGNVEYMKRKFVPFILQASIGHDFELDYDSGLRLEFGYIPVYYNKDAKNLGEYLFRSNAYPTFIESGFDLVDKYKVSGLHLKYEKKLGENSLLKLEDYTYFESNYFPLYDISQAFMGSFNFENMVEIGAGVLFHSLISANKHATTPGLDPGGNRSYHTHYVNDPNPLDTIPGDTTYYTTRATKLMGRVTLNPLAMIGMETGDDLLTFGKHDLKIFAEIAVLGWKNQLHWYEKRSERMPIMFGLNLPAFNVLDVLSFQMQYLKSRYYNTLENYFKQGQMIPNTGSRIEVPTWDDFKADTTNKFISEFDDWKWSLFMSKRVHQRIEFKLQFACDNMIKRNLMPPPPTPSRYTEITTQTWMTKDVPVYDATGAPLLDDDGNPVTTKEEIFGKVRDWYWFAQVLFYF